MKSNKTLILAAGILTMWLCARGSATGFILWNPLQDEAVDVDGDTVRNMAMLKAAEKHVFLTMRTVGVCKKSYFNSGFKANILDFGRWSNKIREKYSGLF